MARGGTHEYRNYGSALSVGEEGSFANESTDVEEEAGLVPMKDILSAGEREAGAFGSYKWSLAALLVTFLVVLSTVTRTAVNRLSPVGTVAAWMKNPLNAEIRDDMLDDSMSVDCIPSPTLKNVPAQLQLLSGFQVYGIPSGGAILGDRGQFTSLKGGTYDYLESYQDTVNGYELMLSACTDIANGAKQTDPHCPDVASFTKSSNQINIIEANLLFNTTQGSSKAAGVSCIESCVQDRFFAYSETAGDPPAYTACKDPVNAAMVYGAPLMKSCFSANYDCTEGGKHSCPFTSCFDCITECLEAEYV